MQKDIDKQKKCTEMKHEEWTNALADEQATNARDETRRGRKRQPQRAVHLEESQVLLEFCGEAAHCNITDAILRVTTEDSKQETMQQCKWSHKCKFDWVNWDSMELAVKKLKKQDCCMWLRIANL